MVPTLAPALHAGDCAGAVGRRFVGLAGQPALPPVERPRCRWRSGAAPAARSVCRPIPKPGRTASAADPGRDASCAGNDAPWPLVAASSSCAACTRFGTTPAGSMPGFNAEIAFKALERRVDHIDTLLASTAEQVEVLLDARGAGKEKAVEEPLKTLPAMRDADEGSQANPGAPAGGASERRGPASSGLAQWHRPRCSGAAGRHRRNAGRCSRRWTRRCECRWTCHPTKPMRWASR
jgi:hypothetical protein